MNPTTPPVPTTPPATSVTESGTAAASPAVDSAIDWVFFIAGGAAAIWLASVLFVDSFRLGWGGAVLSIVFWILLAYLVLPRLHSILTRIYVPGYFIGRARTSDGLLGDPVNLAFNGSEAQLHAVMEAAGWTRADDLTLTTGWRIVASTLARHSYLQAPVSPLLLFDRTQDFAYQQQVDGSPGKRHHVRFWKSPAGWMLPGGFPADWLAAGTYDRRVGLSLFTLQVTHKIAADTDAERDHILSTITAADRAVAVATIRDFSTGYHARNGGGDSITTDGDLPVVDLGAVDAGAEQPGAGAGTDSRDKRPAPTVVGAVFVVARAVLAAMLAVAVLLRDPVAGGTAAVAGAGGITAAQWAAAGVLAAFALTEAFVARTIFLGRNWARVAAMALSLVAVIGHVIGVTAGGFGSVLVDNLAGFSVDVLLLLALSSDRARVYARRIRKVPKRIAGRPGDAASV